MSDNEIIKALECCANNRTCHRCPLEYIDGTCRIILCSSALSLINRQSKKIGRLEKSNRNWRRKAQRLRGTANSYKAEVETISAVNVAIRDQGYKYGYKDGCKEFAERLKKEMTTVGFDIADLVEEMVGDDDGE